MKIPVSSFSLINPSSYRLSLSERNCCGLLGKACRKETAEDGNLSSFAVHEWTLRACALLGAYSVIFIVHVSVWSCSFWLYCVKLDICLCSICCVETMLSTTNLLSLGSRCFAIYFFWSTLDHAVVSEFFRLSCFSPIKLGMVGSRTCCWRTLSSVAFSRGYFVFQVFLRKMVVLFNRHPSFQRWLSAFSHVYSLEV